MIPDQRPLGNNPRRGSHFLAWGRRLAKRPPPRAMGAAAITAEGDFSESEESLCPVVGRSREGTRKSYSCQIPHSGPPSPGSACPS